MTALDRERDRPNAMALDDPGILEQSELVDKLVMEEMGGE